MRRGKNYWQEMIENFRGSGMTCRQFCQDQEISAATFYYWRKKLDAQSDDGGNLVPVEVSEGGPEAGFTITFPIGIRLDMPLGADPEWLGSVISHLASV